MDTLSNPEVTTQSFSVQQAEHVLDPNDTGIGREKEDSRDDKTHDPKSQRRFFRSIPPKKKKKREGNTVGALKRKGSERSRPFRESNEELDDGDIAIVSGQEDAFVTPLVAANHHVQQQLEDDEEIVEPEPREKPKLEIEDPGRVTYVEEFSNMSVLVRDFVPQDVGVHFPIPKVGKDSAVSAIAIKMSNLELEILQMRGALSLPPRELCDELIQAYFEWIAPVVPILNKSSFMKRYRDKNNPPSILLMQAILLAGSRVCATPLLLDSNGSEIPAATLFYQRCKALYDADYEDDRVAIVQALILMGWYWEDPGRVPRDVFHWNGLAITIAQGCGMHRSTKASRLSPADQRLWRRIWWTLYTRDRSVAAALGRPTHISLANSDIEMVCEGDFIEEDVLPNSLHVQFFLHYVKICEIMNLVLFQNYSISPKAQRHSAMALTQCDLALAEWLQNCPADLRWEQSRYNLWSAYLQIVYNTTSCLLHRAHLPPAPSPPLCAILTRSPAFESAHNITLIIQDIISHDDLRHSPPFVYERIHLHVAQHMLTSCSIYSILSALMVHIYHLHTAMPSEVEAQRKSILLCMAALERVSELWLVGKMVRDLFETVLAFDGFDFCLTGSRLSQQLTVKDSDPQLSILAEGSTPLSQSSDSSFKKLPLTASLITHMNAALESATAFNQSEPIPDSSGMSGNVLPSQSKQGPLKYLRTTVPSSEYLGAYNPLWMDHEATSPPGSTGLNAAEWFQFFGIQ